MVLRGLDEPAHQLGDLQAYSQSNVAESEAPVTCMRLLASTALRNSPAFRFTTQSLQPQYQRVFIRV